MSTIARRRSTTFTGFNFSDTVKTAVWNKARTISGQDSRFWRVDACGAYMYWPNYGETVEGKFGWEIDHINPVAHGGTDDITNIQALQWQNNRAKSDSVGVNYCVI